MKLLSLNGGGCCGFMTAALLAKIERETGKQTYELFDLISGVSTGSIIAAGMGIGITAEEMASLYKKLAVDIFKKKDWRPWRAWYSAEKLEVAVKEILHYQFNTAKTRIMIHAAEINGPDVLQPKFWKSWQESDTLVANHIVVASCSAPIYFAPKVIGNDVYIDGGFVSNNPSMCAIVEALRLKSNLSDMSCLNLNCGEQKGFDKAQKLDSIIKWIPQISSLPTLAIRTGERSVAYQARQLLKDNYVEAGPSIDLPLDTLDFKLMEDEVEKIWIDKKYDILRILQKE